LVRTKGESVLQFPDNFMYSKMRLILSIHHVVCLRVKEKVMN